jgi:hypothetical protein
MQTGDFEPLDVAIPEPYTADVAVLSIARRLPRRAAKYQKTFASPAGFEPASPT